MKHRSGLTRRLSGEERDEVLASRTCDASHADDLSGMHAEIDTVNVATAEVVHIDQDVVTGRARAAAPLNDLVSDHELDQPVVIEFVDSFGRHTAAVAEHRDDVGDLEHLVEVMRDVEDGDTAFLQASYRFEQVHDVGRRQGRSRLVENQQMCIVLPTEECTRQARRPSSAPAPRTPTGILTSTLSKPICASARRARTTSARQLILPNLVVKPLPSARFSTVVRPSTRPRS